MTEALTSSPTRGRIGKPGGGGPKGKEQGMPVCIDEGAGTLLGAAVLQRSRPAAGAA